MNCNDYQKIGKEDPFMLSKSNILKLWSLTISAIIIMAAVTLSPAPGYAKNYIVYPTDDVSIWGGPPPGKDTSIRLYACHDSALGDCHIYIKFDLSSLAIPADEKITRYTLKLFSDDMRPPEGVDVQLFAIADNNWTTSSITWDNKPAQGPLLATTHALATWDQWLVSSAGLPTTGQISFLLFSINGEGAIFHSNENDTNRPYLVVSTGGVGTGIYSLLLWD